MDSLFIVSQRCGPSVSMHELDGQLFQMIYLKTVLKEQHKKSFATVSKAVFGEASFWHFTSNLHLFFFLQRCLFIQFSH